jgi:hypothetical protein
MREKISAIREIAAGGRGGRGAERSRETASDGGRSGREVGREKGWMCRLLVPSLQSGEESKEGQFRPCTQ